MGFWGRYLTDAECDRLSLPSVYPFASFGANVDSVLIQPGGSQTFPGFSLDVTLQVFPRGPNRDARLYWKPNTASSSAYSLVGAATYNPSSSDYDITWIFPSCTELPPGLPDTQQASLKAIVFGADQIAQTDQNNSYALTGRGC